MITGKDINGISYNIPESGDNSWGDYTTALLQALVDSSIFTGSGSSKQLVSDLNLGGVYGVIAAYFTSAASNPSTDGEIRLANGDVVSWRNNANSGNIDLTVTGADNRLIFNGVAIPTATSTDTLTNKSLSDSTTAIVDVVDPTIKIKFDAAGTTGTSTTLLSSQTTDTILTLPNATDTLVGKATQDTFTNKTFDADGTGNSISNIENADIK